MYPLKSFMTQSSSQLSLWGFVTLAEEKAEIFHHVKNVLCAIRWMDSLLSEFTNLQRIILVGSYSTHYFLGNGSLTSYIQEYACNDSIFVVLPHPSPRNNIWLKKK